MRIFTKAISITHNKHKQSQSQAKPTAKQNSVKMTTIKVLVDKLTNGYGPICAYFNEHKPEDWMPIGKLDRSEGGFSIRLTPEERRQHLAFVGSMYDANDVIRQLRWNSGRLEPQGYIPFSEEQTELLFKALQHSLGESNVKMIDTY